MTHTPTNGTLRRSPWYGRVGTPEGEVKFGDVWLNNTKLACTIRNVTPGKPSDHYIALACEGKIKGSTIERAPAMHQIMCGKEPVDTVAGLFYAENGDIIIGAPRGRIRLYARDIDIMADGFDTKTGWVNILGSSKIELEAGEQIILDAKTSISMEAPKSINLNCDGLVKIVGSFKIMSEAVEFPIQGSNSLIDQAEALRKLLNSVVG